MTRPSRSQPIRTARRESIQRPLCKLRTVPETAEIIHTSERTVQRLIADGRLRAHRIGRLVRIEDDDIAALLDATESLR